MDKPIVFATEVPNNSIPIAKPVPIHPTLASAPPVHAVYPSAPFPSHMNRHTPYMLKQEIEVTLAMIYVCFYVAVLFRVSDQMSSSFFYMFLFFIVIVISIRYP